MKTQLIRSEAHDGKIFIGSPCEVQKWSFYTASGWVPNSGIQIKDEKSIMTESKLMDKLKKDKAIADQKVTDLEERKNYEEEKKENTSTKKQMQEEAITFDELALKLSEVAFLCDEWWEITHEDNINNLEKAFKHD